MKTVILIDDQPELLELLEYLFIQLNYRAVSFPAAISIEAIADIAPEIVILDHALGTTLGGDLCIELKNHPKTRHIPVILISANENLPYIAEKSCADAYLEKPFDIGLLFKKVKQLTMQEAS